MTAPAQAMNTESASSCAARRGPGVSSSSRWQALDPNRVFGSNECASGPWSSYDEALRWMPLPELYESPSVTTRSIRPSDDAAVASGRADTVVPRATTPTVAAAAATKREVERRIGAQARCSDNA